jgi:hypothetical protein
MAVNIDAGTDPAHVGAHSYGGAADMCAHSDTSDVSTRAYIGICSDRAHQSHCDDTRHKRFHDLFLG